MAELSQKARALFLAGRAGLQPTTADRTRVFALLSARIDVNDDLPPPDSVAAGAGTNSKAMFAVVIALVVAAVVTHGVLRARLAALPTVTSSRSIAPAVSASVSPRAASASDARVANPGTVTDHAATDAPATTPSVRATASDRLGEEVAILTRAEAELHTGRFARALQLLDEHTRAFPHGVLTQERRIARAKALCGLGRFAEGRSELERVPGSFANASAREACSEPLVGPRD
jgi:hypothetical protein